MTKNSFSSIAFWMLRFWPHICAWVFFAFIFIDLCTSRVDIFSMRATMFTCKNNHFYMATGIEGGSDDRFVVDWAIAPSVSPKASEILLTEVLDETSDSASDALQGVPMS